MELPCLETTSEYKLPISQPEISIRGIGAVQNLWEVMGCSFANCSLGWEGCSLLLRWLTDVTSQHKCYAWYWWAGVSPLHRPNPWNVNVTWDKSWLKGWDKACNFSLPDILAIIILSHLLKTKWFLSCRKGQNVIVSVPSASWSFSLEQWETVRNMALISSITWPGVRTLGWSVS